MQHDWDWNICIAKLQICFILFYLLNFWNSNNYNKKRFNQIWSDDFLIFISKYWSGTNIINKNFIIQLDLIKFKIDISDNIVFIFLFYLKKKWFDWSILISMITRFDEIRMYLRTRGYLWSLYSGDTLIKYIDIGIGSSL